MTFIPATESAIVHPNMRREELPLEILLELDAFEEALRQPEPQPQLEQGFEDWLCELEELDTDALEPLDDAPAGQGEAHASTDGWPRSFEEHLTEIRAAGDDPAARRALSLMGLGDIQGLEPAVAAITKTSEALLFWQPMLDMEQDGFFTAHHRELRACLVLLEANPVPAGARALHQRWQAARDELVDLLPGWACQGVAVC